MLEQCFCKRKHFVSPSVQKFDIHSHFSYSEQNKTNKQKKLCKVSKFLHNSHTIFLQATYQFFSYCCHYFCYFSLIVVPPNFPDKMQCFLCSNVLSIYNNLAQMSVWLIFYPPSGFPDQVFLQVFPDLPIQILETGIFCLEIPIFLTFLFVFANNMGYLAYL